MSENKIQSEFAYHSVSSQQNSSEDTSTRPRIELGDHPQLAKKRGWIATAAWQTFAILWLVPIVALMYLNFTEYIVGASAWCPNRDCWLNAFNPVTSIPAERAKKFDEESHNLLGGLQFVAKGLEIWFGVIAAAVMYLYTMRQAGKKEGLPIGYLTRPVEFADLISLMDGLLWRTGPSPFGKKSATEKRVGRRVWTLIILSLFLCTLCQLMGPATAILVLPALQWLDMPAVGNLTFGELNSAQPPSTSGWFFTSTQFASPLYCTEAEFQAQNFSCTLNPYGNALDLFVNSYIATDANTQTSFTTQEGLSFAVNQTSIALTDNSLVIATQENSKQLYRDLTWWVPCRQAISSLSTDYYIVSDMSLGYPLDQISGFEVPGNTDGTINPIDTYADYNKSLDLSIIRNGPILGTQMVFWGDYNYSDISTTTISNNKQVKCYYTWDLSETPLSEQTSNGSYTKCMQVGSAWGGNTKSSMFYTEKQYNPSTGQVDPGVNIYVYASDRAVYFENGNLPSWLPYQCLDDDSIRQDGSNSTYCPWDRVFALDPSSPLYNRTQNLNTIEFDMANSSGYSTQYVVDYVAYYDFTTYSVDANPVSNPAAVVQTGDLPMTAPSVPVDPSWYVAAWSTTPGGTVLSNRTSTVLLTTLMQWKLENPQWQFPFDNTPDYLALVPVLQTLSLIDYSTNPTTETQTTDPLHPLLQRWAKMYVWSYGLTDRTAHLGIAVVIAGSIVVIWHCILGFTDRRRYRSPTQLLVAALEHTPRDEFKDVGHDELAMARVRFHIRDNDEQVGKFSFYPPEKDEMDGAHGGVTTVA